MSRCRPLLLAGALVGLQGLGLLVAGIVEIVGSLAGHPHDRGTAVFLGVCVVIGAAAWGATARGLLRGSRAAQTPTYIEQFLAVVLAVGQLSTLPGIMVPLLVTALGAAFAVSMPSARAELGGI